MDSDQQRGIGNPEAYEIQQRYLRQNAERAMIDMARMMRQQQHAQPYVYVRPRVRAVRLARGLLNFGGVLLILAVAFSILESVLTH